MQMRYAAVLVFAALLIAFLPKVSAAASEAESPVYAGNTVQCTVNQSFFTQDMCGVYNCNITSRYGYLEIELNTSGFPIRVTNTTINAFLFSTDYLDQNMKDILANICVEDLSPLYGRINASQSAFLYNESLLRQSEADSRDFSKCRYKTHEHVGSWLVKTDREKLCASTVLSDVVLAPVWALAGIPLYLEMAVTGNTWCPHGLWVLVFGLIYIYIVTCIIYWLWRRKKDNINLVRGFRVMSKRKLALFILLFMLFFFCLPM